MVLSVIEMLYLIAREIDTTYLKEILLIFLSKVESRVSPRLYMYSPGAPRVSIRYIKQKNKKHKKTKFRQNILIDCCISVKDIQDASEIVGKTSRTYSTLL